MLPSTAWRAHSLPTIRVLILSAVAALTSCLPADCSRVQNSATSRDGAFRADFAKVGDCISSLNTVAYEVEITDLRAWVFRSRAVWVVRGVDKADLIWDAPNRLRVRYYLPGEVIDTVYRSENRWRNVTIVYEPVIGMRLPR
jgi:hypothetical protein